ncbi:hypothetical protein M5K25_001907 [Dendrobium thyrsiflorum]|uniref:Uncharacterized protein n=1 Tax=Dendrobium thyrsiflorum TaxID=117978 RepID=A0ABD0VRD7_DENTH
MYFVCDSLFSVHSHIGSSLLAHQVGICRFRRHLGTGTEKNPSWSGGYVGAALNRVRSSRVSSGSQIQKDPNNLSLNTSLKDTNIRLSEFTSMLATWIIQRAKVNWLKHVEDEFKFLYAKIRNRMGSTKSVVNLLASNPNISRTEVINSITQYFQALYNSPPPSYMDLAIFPIDAALPEYYANSITSYVLDDEIKNAIFVGSSTSAPGPDSFNFHFYKYGKAEKPLQSNLFLPFSPLHDDGREPFFLPSAENHNSSLFHLSTVMAENHASSLFHHSTVKAENLASSLFHHSTVKAENPSSLFHHSTVKAENPSSLFHHSTFPNYNHTLSNSIKEKKGYRLLTDFLFYQALKSSVCLMYDSPEMLVQPENSTNNQFGHESTPYLNYVYPPAFSCEDAGSEGASLSPSESSPSIDDFSIVQDDRASYRTIQNRTGRLEWFKNMTLIRFSLRTGFLTDRSSRRTGRYTNRTGRYAYRTGRYTHLQGELIITTHIVLNDETSYRTILISYRTMRISYWTIYPEFFKSENIQS